MYFITLRRVKIRLSFLSTLYVPSQGEMFYSLV